MIGRSWPAPAKVNLFLHIIGRRSDGYHLLQTAFQFLDCCDQLHFMIRDDDRICRIGNNAGIAYDEDLVIRAALALRDSAGRPLGVDIQVDKQLPVGGGLGGGSSNAATTLVALNHLWDTSRSQDELAEIGLKLGADVPVFVRGHAAWAEGIGEQLSPMTLPEDWFLVLNPGCQVSTAEIFNSPDLTRNTPAITIRDFLAGAGRNDCEAVVRQCYPEVAEAMDWLGIRSRAMVTGSGSCIFAIFNTEKEAQAVLGQIPDNWQGFVARGRNTSPLLDRLAQETD